MDYYQRDELYSDVVPWLYATDPELDRAKRLLRAPEIMHALRVWVNREPDAARTTVPRMVEMLSSPITPAAVPTTAHPSAQGQPLESNADALEEIADLAINAKRVTIKNMLSTRGYDLFRKEVKVNDAEVNALAQSEHIGTNAARLKLVNLRWKALSAAEKQGYTERQNAAFEQLQQSMFTVH